MTDVTQAMESSYIDVDLVRASPTKKAVIIGEGEYVEKEFQGRKYVKFQIPVEIDKKQKTYAPDKDSLKAISEEWDVESKRWVGHILKLSIGKKNGKDVVNATPFE